MGSVLGLASGEKRCRAGLNVGDGSMAGPIQGEGGDQQQATPLLRTSLIESLVHSLIHSVILPENIP